MQAYEFYTTAENGFITIPDEYKKKVGKKIKVTVVNEDPKGTDRDALFPPIIDTKGRKFNREETNARRKSDLLLPPILDTRGWKFDKEEANER